MPFQPMLATNSAPRTLRVRGKTDIYVPLAALHPESPDALMTYYFYAEAKIGTASVLAERAWAQADSYRALRVRRAVLLFYVTAKDLVGVAMRSYAVFPSVRSILLARLSGASPNVRPARSGCASSASRARNSIASRCCSSPRA
jgi:hypothetical protein